MINNIDTNYQRPAQLQSWGINSQWQQAQPQNFAQPPAVSALMMPHSQPFASRCHEAITHVVQMFTQTINRMLEMISQLISPRQVEGEHVAGINGEVKSEPSTGSSWKDALKSVGSSILDKIIDKVGGLGKKVRSKLPGWMGKAFGVISGWFK